MHELLKQIPKHSEMPSTIEALELACFELAQDLRLTNEAISEHEEAAASEAAGESNADKRRTRRAEILRANDEYAALCVTRTEQERERLRLSERASRLRRELRLHLLNLEITKLGRRS